MGIRRGRLPARQNEGRAPVEKKEAGVETLAGIRDFCIANGWALKSKWVRFASLGLEIHIHELDNARRNLLDEPLIKRSRLYVEFRNASSELREACAKFGVSVSEFKPEDIATLLR